MQMSHSTTGSQMQRNQSYGNRNIKTLAENFELDKFVTAQFSNEESTTTTKHYIYVSKINATYSSVEYFCTEGFNTRSNLNSAWIVITLYIRK